MTTKNTDGTCEENIKPEVTIDEIKKILSDSYGLKGEAVVQLRGYDDLNFHFQPESNSNPFIKSLWPYGYVLKVMNTLDSKNKDLCEAQNSMMLFLREHNIRSPIPVQTTQGNYYLKQKFVSNKSDIRDTEKWHIIRLLEFQPGTILKHIPKSHYLLYKLGEFLATFNEVLKDFSHPFYKTHSSIWHLNSVPEIRTLTHVIENPERRRLVETVIEKFTEVVEPKVKNFEKGMIHGDFNEHNILIEKGTNGNYEISAILDFGDSHHSYYIFELAIALCYMMIECKEQNLDPVVGGGHVLAGYLTIRPRFSVDFGLLKLCICARLCQSLVLGLKAFSLHPENGYVLDSQEKGWPLLEELWRISENKITEDWCSVIQSYVTTQK